MNLLQLFGRLGADPETRFTSSGLKVTTFRMACNSKKGGQEITTWWRVTVWGDRFDKLMPHIKKGSALIVSGTMNKPDIYTDKNGNPQVSLEITADSIHFSPFGSKSESSHPHSNTEQSSYEETSSHAHTPSYSSGYADSDDEQIPF